MNRWLYSPDYGEVCQVIDEQNVFGEAICRVWLPVRYTVIRIPLVQLKPLDEAPVGNPDWIAYVVTAAKISDSLSQNILLAPLSSSVIPLPHQLRALSRVISSNKVRYLLADEVGLGKTIEAGLIMKELKSRGLVKRTLVIAPKGIVNQWISEMKTRFNEIFNLIIPSDLPVYKRISKNSNIWKEYDQIVCPMDSVKPIESRRGWTKEQIDEYNQERFEQLVSAGWDLIIVDEAHRLGGSTEQVARYKLGQGLAEAAPYLLLLSATPHQGKTDHFWRLMSLLDTQAFPDLESINKEKIWPYVIRTEKRQAIDPEGKPLFKPRLTRLEPISWEARHRHQWQLYEAVTEYVREGYDQARREKSNYISFLMSLMQRLVSSSTRAIRTALEKRLAVLESPEEQLSLFPIISDDEWADLDGQEQMDLVLKARLKALKNEKEEVRLLLESARRCEVISPDAKAEALLQWIYRLQAEERDPNLKFLIFTEFLPTQEMLFEFLTERGFKVVCLNGSMDMDERLQVMSQFAEQAKIMISTDAGGEGLNLQFCHIVINYDIPWNPMRLEQRIGRVDRIGQENIVRVINLILARSIEYRVLEVLEQKLGIIYQELGIDKTGDVLDSAEAEYLFTELYSEAIINPNNMYEKIDETIEKLKEQARDRLKSISIFSKKEELSTLQARSLIEHPLPYWVERMTISYLLAHASKAEKKDGIWNIIWPDQEKSSDVVFTYDEAKKKPHTVHLTLESPRIRRLVNQLPHFVEGQVIPVIFIPGLISEVNGYWSLWKISISAPGWNRQRIMPLFRDDYGKDFMPTAKHIWDQLVSTDPRMIRYLDAEFSKKISEEIRIIAERRAKDFYWEMVQAYREYLIQEQAKWEFSFSSKRKAIENIGLHQVRNYRLNLLKKEEERIREEYEMRRRVIPELTCLLIVRVEHNLNG